MKYEKFVLGGVLLATIAGLAILFGPVPALLFSTTAAVMLAFNLEVVSAKQRFLEANVEGYASRAEDATACRQRLSVENRVLEAELETRAREFEVLRDRYQEVIEALAANNIEVV